MIAKAIGRLPIGAVRQGQVCFVPSKHSDKLLAKCSIRSIQVNMCGIWTQYSCHICFFSHICKCKRPMLPTIRFPTALPLHGIMMELVWPVSFELLGCILNYSGVWKYTQLFKDAACCTAVHRSQVAIVNIVGPTRSSFCHCTGHYIHCAGCALLVCNYRILLHDSHSGNVQAFRHTFCNITPKLENYMPSCLLSYMPGQLSAGEHC